MGDQDRGACRHGNDRDKIIRQAMDLLGAHGSDRAADVEKHWRDFKIVQLWMGGKQLCQMEAARYYYGCETL